MAASDLIAALVALQKADAVMAGIASDRIFGGELPSEETPNMPRRAIVIRESGGTALTGRSNLGHDAQRVDLFAYGATPQQASMLRAEAALAFRRAEPGTYAGVLIHSVNSAGGASSRRDPDTDWPRAFQSFQAFYGLEAIS